MAELTASRQMRTPADSNSIRLSTPNAVRPNFRTCVENV